VIDEVVTRIEHLKVGHIEDFKRPLLQTPSLR